jgi:hypothetical protein
MTGQTIAPRVIWDPPAVGASGHQNIRFALLGLVWDSLQHVPMHHLIC